MKVLFKGHRYVLDNMEGGVQFLDFIQKEVQEGSFVTTMNGTTNEEVLAVLIDRLEALQEKAPHAENETAIKDLCSARDALGRRTAERKARGVEGTPAV